MPRAAECQQMVLPFLEGCAQAAMAHADQPLPVTFRATAEICGICLCCQTTLRRWSWTDLRLMENGPQVPIKMRAVLLG